MSPFEERGDSGREPIQILEWVWEDFVRLARSVDATAELIGRIKEATSARAKARRIRGQRVLDSIGVRIVVRETAECYRVMLRLHREFSALVEAYDDYIATPKPNGYQSLHTILLTAHRDPIEVQVRTREMHRNAVDGHAAYKRELQQWTADRDRSLRRDARTA